MITKYEYVLDENGRMDGKTGRTKAGKEEKRKKQRTHITCHSYDGRLLVYANALNGSRSDTTYSLDFHFDILIRYFHLVSFLSLSLSRRRVQDNIAAEFEWNIYDRIGIIHERCGFDVIICFSVFFFLFIFGCEVTLVGRTGAPM